MLFPRRILISCFVILCGICPAVAKCTSNHERKVEALLRAKFPNAEVTSIRRLQGGNWEAFVDGQIVYLDRKERYFFAGSIYDVSSMRNLTDERLVELRQMPFSALPKNLAIVRTKGRGDRELAVFEDPFCGFCRKLEPELDKLDNYRAYIFTYPLFGDKSQATVSAIWCSSDRLLAWESALKAKDPSKEEMKCNEVAASITRLAKRLGISGTPTLLFSDSTRHVGFMSSTDINAKLNATSAAGGDTSTSYRNHNDGDSAHLSRVHD